ncbi:hypothetical protein [Microseira wollei]|uniref:Uncharacterized protein n=1 Tax=Microseira wollei NIES-4236 TaxID=2530354 RepID=A0AAV3WJS7_9CYAN|nr:hypothetical protein [Microseira wollei]GET40509.1 hypothetical protein Cyan7822_3222 [Microseira wollei NIES-4236]
MESGTTVAGREEPKTIAAIGIEELKALIARAVNEQLNLLPKQPNNPADKKVVADLKIEEFKALIAPAIAEQLKIWLNQQSSEEKKVADLTVAELRTLITQIVDERLILWVQPPHPKNTRSPQEILAAMDRLRWTPPPGAPTGSEMIIAEREKWRQPM